MSILKQILVEDLASLLRRSRIGAAPNLRVATKKAAVPIVGQVTNSDLQHLGMKVVILNWKSGENDPFTIASATMAQHFRAYGKNVEIIEITDPDWPLRLVELRPGGIEFVLTWQGLGSAVQVAEIGESLWDHMRVPLICIHGDHPCHMPLNHQLESRYCVHLYTNADFARYSNRHFRRYVAASVIDLPQLVRETRRNPRAGDYFVFAKNINDPIETERLWQQRLDKPVFDMYMAAAETLKSLVAAKDYVEIHEVLDESLAAHDLPEVTTGLDASYHQYHSQLDHYIRSYKSVAVVAALRDFPVRVYGRGWDRIAQSAPRTQIFEPARDMRDSQDLYYTRFGIVDVSPSKGLHDRTRRAMVNGSGFLSSAKLEDQFADIELFDRLFFTFRPAELAEKCAAVIRDPDAHRHTAFQFGCKYHERFHFTAFARRIEHLARNASLLGDRQTP